MIPGNKIKLVLGRNVFFTLAKNIIRHGKTATEVTFTYRETDYGFVLAFEDNVEGVNTEMKEKIVKRNGGGRYGPVPHGRDPLHHRHHDNKEWGTRKRAVPIYQAEERC